MDLGVLRDKIGPLPGWGWVVLGGGGIAGLAFFMRGKGGKAVPGAVATPLVPNADALGPFGGGGGGFGGGGVGVAPPAAQPVGPAQAPGPLPDVSQRAINTPYTITDPQTGNQNFVEYLPNGTASWGVSLDAIHQGISAYQGLPNLPQYQFPAGWATALGQQGPLPGTAVQLPSGQLGAVGG